MLKFIPAAELKKEFAVFGHFYSIGDINYRSVLEIVHKNIAITELGSLSSVLPDAIFIMMNPGSSKPLTEVSNSISINDIGQLEVSLVPTKPDTTQYQLMRVMKYCNWTHVRVLNLSDMRDPKSGNFFERYKNIENEMGLKEHSIFSDTRENELKKKLKRKSNAPIVYAWGVSSELDPLIERCINKIPQIIKVKGVLKDGTKNKYFHPLPTLQRDKEKWVYDMVKQIKT